MITQAQLLAKNNPTTAKQFIFSFGEAAAVAVILDVIDGGNFSGDISAFEINTPVGMYLFTFTVTGGTTTNLSIFESLEAYFPGSVTPVTDFDTPYFNVIYYSSKIYIVLRSTCTVDISEPTALGDTTGTYNDTYILKFAPDGWEDDEYQLKRDMKLFGVFRKFTVAEMKFPKDGRDYLLARYEETGVNTDTTFTVTENTPSGNSRVRFIGKIDYSTFKRTEISVDVQVIDGAFTDLVLRRANIDVNLFGEKTIDGATAGSATTQTIIRPEIILNQFANWTSGTGTITKTASHILPTSIEASEYDEAEATDEFSLYMFLNASQDYLQSMIYTDIVAVAHGNDANAYFSWVIKCDRYSGGSFVDNIWEETFICEGLTTDIVISNAYGINLLEGESIKIHAVYTPSIGTGNIVYDASEGIKFRFNWLVSNYAEANVRGVLYHEAFTRIIKLLTGTDSKFYSEFCGRTDLGYTADGVIGAILTGRDFNGANFWNDTLTVSLQRMYDAMRAIYCVGMGIETIGGVEKVVIEDMAHFFDANVILNISDRIAPETIEKQYYPELAFNRISVGYNSFDYSALGGIYEFNTTSKYSTIIKPVEKELNIVSPIRADMSGMIKCIELGGTNYDDDSLQDVFIADTIRDGTDFIIRTDEDFEFVENISNRNTLINLAISPARNIRRSGSYIRGCLEKNLTSDLIWQASDKNTKVESTEWGGSLIVENADIPVSELNDPLWHPEIFTLEVSALENDIDLIKANPYGLIKITDTEYGWIISYRSKNENKKSEFTLLRCNTSYVTPIGDPVYPATITIKKTVTDAVVDYTTFGVNLVGDNGTTYLNLPIQNGEAGQIQLTNVPYGTYTITEVTEPGYTLTSITPSTVTIDADNLHFDIEIVNEFVGIIETIKYGALYNWYDIANVARNGFEVPSVAKMAILSDYLGITAGGKLKEIGTEYWAAPNYGATNEVNFNGRAGIDGLGVYYASIDEYGEFCLNAGGLEYDSDTFFGGYVFNKNARFACRPLKTTPTAADLLKSDGEACDPYFDGEYYYRTVKIGTQVWVADNIKTRYYSDDSPIPVVTDNAAWAALTTGAMCYYNNDINNA